MNDITVEPKLRRAENDSRNSTQPSHQATGVQAEKLKRIWKSA